LSRQNEVKKYPVPPLQETLSKYLKTVPQFLDKGEFETTVEAVKELGQQGGDGERLQLLLEDKASKSENWLADWWLDLAYLTYRSPVVVWSSPGIVWPRREFGDVDDQLDYASKVIAGLTDFKLMLEKQALPVETIGGSPMDMMQYYRLFGTSRIPAEGKDKMSYNPDSKHIVVLHRNHFFKMAVFSPEGNALPESQLLGNLKYIRLLADGIMAGRIGRPGPPIGLLSSDNRDNWADSYQVLLEGGNEEALREIETALFTISLDDEKEADKSESNLGRAAAFSIHGGGPDWAAGNRWFDKTIQVHVCRNGDNGMTYEHSPAEAVALMKVTDHTLHCANGGSKFAPPNLNPAQGVELPTQIAFKNADMVERHLALAHNNLHNLASDLNMNPLHFKTFGKGFIKRQKCSPDSFLQIAFQAAFYLVHGKPAGHYESGGLRIFKEGRTDIIRSCSVESVEFGKLLSDKTADSGEKFVAMKKALAAHSNYAKMVVQGGGVDRHLLGLKMIAKENGIPLPKLFSDDSYTRSMYHHLSTSQVSGSSESFVCFGPLVMDGYGICYNIRERDLILGLSSMLSCRETHLGDFRAAVEDSLVAMHDLFVKHGQTSNL